MQEPFIAMSIFDFFNRKQRKPAGKKMESRKATAVQATTDTAQNAEEAMWLNRPIPIMSNVPFGIQVLHADAGGPITESYGNIPVVKDYIGLIRPADLKTLSLDRWAAPLTERYGTKKFAGYFVSRLNEAENLSGMVVATPVSAEQALQQAIRMSRDFKEGYLVVTVEGNQFRPRDLLIMDVNNGRWLSANKSKSKALALYHAQFAEYSAQEEASPITRGNAFSLQAKGVVIKPNESWTATMQVTTDGIVWYRIPLESQAAQDMDDAYDEGYFIDYFPHEHKARFATERGAPLFESLDEVDVYRDGLEAGLEVEVKDYHPILRFKKEFVPNILLEVNDKWVPAGGEVVGNIPSTASDVEFAKDVMKLSKHYPDKTIVIKRPTNNTDYQPGQINQYVVCMD